MAKQRIINYYEKNVPGNSVSKNPTGLCLEVILILRMDYWLGVKYYLKYDTTSRHTNIYLPMIHHNHSDNTSEISHSSKQRDYLTGLAEIKSSLLHSVIFLMKF